MDFTEYFPLIIVEDRLRLPAYSETSNTGSSACFAVATYWLRTCLSKHKSCNRHRPSSLRDWRPNRLISIDDQGASLRLCEAEEIPSGVQYATLSHCWGDISEGLVLKTENLSSWLQRIPDLGRMETFRHAIHITQELGLRYVWIDSLCIIQDSIEDWLQQSSLMGRVYQYSQCNITATAATDDTMGCFFPRDPDISLPTRFEFVHDQVRFQNNDWRPTAEPFLRRGQPGTLQGPYDLHEHQTWISGVRYAPVNRRSWVVQEVCANSKQINCTDIEALLASS